jgi:hypothetical protein
LYVGQFIVSQKCILYHTGAGSEGSEGILIELESSEKYIKYKGIWRDGNIVEGTK